MFKQLNSKQKLYALIILFFLIGITAYKRSFSTFINLLIENKKLRLNIEKFENLNSNLKKIESDINKLDYLTGKNNVSHEEIQQQLIKFIAKNDNSISIQKMEPIHFYEENNIKYITNCITVNGNANNLTKLLFDFEKKFQFSKVRSLIYYVENKSNSKKLYLKLIFQNYENIN